MKRRRPIIPVALIALALSTPSAFGRGRGHGGGGHGGGHSGGGHGGGHPHPVSAPHPHAPSHPKNHASSAPKQHPTAPKNHASASAPPHHPVAHNAPKHAATTPQAPKSAAVKTADRGSSGASKPSTGKSTAALASTDKTVTKPANTGSNTLKTATGSAGLATTGIGVGGTHSRGYQYNRNANPNTIAPLLMVGAMTNPNFSGRNWGYHHHYYGGYHRGYRRRWYNNNGMNNNIAYRRLMRLKHDLDMIRPGMTLQNRHTQYLSRDLMGVVRPGNQRPPTPVVHNLASHVATALTHRSHRRLNTLMLAKHLAVIMNHGGGNPNQLTQSMNGGTSLLRSAGVPAADSQQIGRDLQMVAMSGTQGTGGFLN